MNDSILLGHSVRSVRGVRNREDIIMRNQDQNTTTCIEGVLFQVRPLLRSDDACSISNVLRHETGTYERARRYSVVRRSPCRGAVTGFRLFTERLSINERKKRFVLDTRAVFTCKPRADPPLILEAIMPMQTMTQHSQAMPQKPHSLIASDRVEATPVRRSNGENIGAIRRLMIDKISGKVAYAILNFGGFLGIGEKHYPVPWERIKYSRALDAYEINLSEDELSRAPSYAGDKDFDWGNREDEVMIHTFYKIPPYWGAY